MAAKWHVVLSFVLGALSALTIFLVPGSASATACWNLALPAQRQPPSSDDGPSSASSAPSGASSAPSSASSAPSGIRSAPREDAAIRLAWKKPVPRPNPVWDRPQDVEVALRDHGSIWRTPGACDGKPRPAAQRGTVTWAQLQERLSSLDAFIDANRKEQDVPHRWRLIPKEALKNVRGNGVFARAYKDSVKAWRIWQLISRDAGFDWRGFCEIGINYGHSAIMWLEANPDSCVYLWDLPDFKTQEPMMPFGIQYLKEVYSDRVVIIQGDHTTAIQDFHSMFPDVTCDVISIDGPKEGGHRALDYDRFQLLANDRTMLLIDDTAPEDVTNFLLPSAKLKSDTERVTREWVKSGKLEVLAAIPLSLPTEAADGIYPGPNPKVGHGTLVARYPQRPR